MLSSEPEKLTEEQVTEYLKRLQIRSKPGPTLEGLKHLCIQHLQCIPFENFSLHFTKKRPPIPSLLLENVFNKIVRRKRGGYCFELNSLFAALLESLGFSIINGSARVYFESNGTPGYTNENHHIIIVNLDGESWLADVGFGGPGPCLPMTFSNSPQPTENGIGIEQTMLELQDENTWLVKQRFSPVDDWKPTYKTTLEIRDGPFYDKRNESVATGPTIFTEHLVAVILRDNKGSLERVSMMDTKVSVSGTNHYSLVDTFRNEDERIGGIEHWFNVGFTDEEVLGISGSHLALGSSS
jgi:arylamine N-acetyltransferase